MKISFCKGCLHCKRRTWSQVHHPANYHTIGINHAYLHCALADKRCLKVKKSECSKIDVYKIKSSFSKQIQNVVFDEFIDNKGKEESK